MRFLEELAARRRFGMKPGLDTIRAVMDALGNPERRVKAIHIAGTNGKGATAAMLDASLRAAGLRVARYTSPHLMRINERFFLDGQPISDALLEGAAERVAAVAPGDMTFFEALTAVAFLAFAESAVDLAILETGLGGRLDATNICNPVLSVITRIGLDHCDWLGNTVEEIATEKAGIIKRGVPVVIGKNSQNVREVFERRAAALSAPLVYAPEIASESEIPRDFSLRGSFNRENAVTAIAALKQVSSFEFRVASGELQLESSVTWPGRFQRAGRFLIDGAHNPPAATALRSAILEEFQPPFSLIAGFCGDKDIESTLQILKPLVSTAFAVKTNNPRSLSPDAVAAKMNAVGIPATPCDSLEDAIRLSTGQTLICGSLFLAGEALVALGAYPWNSNRLDPSELLRS